MKEFEGIDLKEKLNRAGLETLLEKVYLNQVIVIQHVGRKVTRVCGKVHRIAVDYKNDEPICIIMLNETRYEFDLGYFIQKALIQQQDGYTRTTDSSD